MSVPEETSTASGSGGTGSSFPVVGIGASAGGLEACVAFLKALDTNLGMAFVMVPHLDPSHASAYQEILARATSLPSSKRLKKCA